MGKRLHYQGSKHKGTHTSVTEKASEFIRSAEKLVEVVGIAPGIIKMGLKIRQPKILFKKMSSGLEVHILGPQSKQIVRLYTDFPELVEQKLISKN